MGRVAGGRPFFLFTGDPPHMGIPKGIIPFGGVQGRSPCPPEALRRRAVYASGHISAPMSRSLNFWILPLAVMG